jgi:uncharacterized RDD family membrane protein YckC
LEGYTIQRCVGRGGFGEVYYAVSDGGREVALKYLRDNPAIELRGVSHCMNLNSPHLVKIFDVKKNADGEYFIVMEYVQGPSLRDVLIAEPEGLGPQKAAFFVRELAKGLGYLHDRGIIHRDMKPGNIFYEEGYVKIGDYGLSKFISVSRHSAQTASVGTVHYMAPEVGSGHYHRGIDIYALGVVLYEMLLGRVPFEGSSMGEVLMKHLTTQPAVDELPEPFGQVIHKALAKGPKDRYQTVGEMAEDLLGVDEVKASLAGFDTMSLTNVVRRAAAQPEPPAHVPGPPPPPPRPGGERSRGLKPEAQGRAARASAEEAYGRGGAVGVRGAFRDLANATGDALKAAAAGVPVGTPVGQAPPLSPEAATGYVRYAGFWIRFCAAFIDVIIVGPAGELLGLDDATGILLILYSAILIGTWNGQTLGKRACGIKVISADGCHCTLGQAFGRTLAEILNVFTLMVGYLMVAFDDKKRGLHDRIAGTLHIYAIP